MQSPYRGASIALGTMHGKERAIAPPFSRVLQAEIAVPPQIDTDIFGTFTGEIERQGTMLDAARAKARLAMNRIGTPFGIASEGTYGPHPYLPFLPGGSELVLFIDEKRGIEIKQTFVVTHTNYNCVASNPGDDLASNLTQMKFPTHAVTVRPNQPLYANAIKGLTDRSEVIDAVQTCAALSADSKALLVPDMRAHLNPTRMAMIRIATVKLVRRIATSCPSCALPGFGIVDVMRGWPCSECGAPTSLVMAEIHRCTGCGYETRKPVRRDDEGASPAQCPCCNP